MAPTDFPAPQPEPIAGFSPSLANQLLTCALRTAFARDPQHRSWRRPNTFTALGLIAHAVTESAFTRVGPHGDEPSARAELAQRWDSETGRVSADLDAAWAPAMPPPPPEWPGYALTRTRTIRRASKIVATRAEAPRPVAKGIGGIEIDLRDPSTGLFGRADRIERVGASTRIVDLKTGLRQDEPTEEQRRQLLLYAVLVQRTTGEWPESIAIENASGAQYVTPFEPAEAERALEEVQTAIAAFNEGADAPESLVAAAEPSDDRCRWCAYRVACGPYWVSVESGWNHRAAFGTITEASSAGDSHYLRMAVDSPTDQSGQVLHVSQLAGPVPAGATKVAIVDWAGTPGEQQVRARWSTLVRAW